MGDEASIILGSAAGTAVVFMMAIMLALRKVRPWMHMADDMLGEDARPGGARQPGLVERIADNERLTLVAAEQAAASVQSSRRVEELMRRHMENGQQIMEVGVHNDAQLYEALGEAGITVRGLREYPPVDTGEDIHE